MNRHFLFLAFFSLAGCASTQQFIPTASVETLQAGNALIEVSREAGILGAGRSVTVNDDGKPVGQLATGDTIFWQRRAGQMAVGLEPAFAVVQPREPIKLTVEPGKRYRFVVRWNMSANTTTIEGPQ